MIDTCRLRSVEAPFEICVFLELFAVSSGLEPLYARGLRGVNPTVDLSIPDQFSFNRGRSLACYTDQIGPIGERLETLSESVIGLKTRVVAESQEVTILADKSVPFNVIKKVMSTCTGRGYSRISLAVLQKASQVAQI